MRKKNNQVYNSPYSFIDTIDKNIEIDNKNQNNNFDSNEEKK